MNVSKFQASFNNNAMQPTSLICSTYLKNKALPKQECTNIYTDLHANSKSHQNICKNSTHATNKTAKSAKLNI